MVKKKIALLVLVLLFSYFETLDCSKGAYFIGHNYQSLSDPNKFYYSYGYEDKIDLNKSPSRKYRKYKQFSFNKLRSRELSITPNEDDQKYFGEYTSDVKKSVKGLSRSLRSIGKRKTNNLKARSNRIPRLLPLKIPPFTGTRESYRAQLRKELEQFRKRLLSDADKVRKQADIIRENARKLIKERRSRAANLRKQLVNKK
ncbi:apolipoprotein A [Acrasis kona]|uniref:Apolipoprotein A n=1 Tax=Acrasis kona TaxID=1008807 RepID=A0AAW2ZJN2_9EUKA